MNIIWKKTLISLGLILTLLLISSLIINILYFFDIVNNNTVKYFKMIFILISFFSGGIYMGKHSPNKGYIYGLRLSLLTIILLVTAGFVLNKINLSTIIYYIIVTFCITFGSMIGINKKN